MINKYRNKVVYFNPYTMNMIDEKLFKAIITTEDSKNYIRFHSIAECNYYRNLLLIKRTGEIKDIELQPKFELIKTFKKNGKTYRGVTYNADFKVTYKDGKVEIIDVKGRKTKDFIIKEKLFEYLYPDLSLKVVDSNGNEI